MKCNPCQKSEKYIDDGWYVISLPKLQSEPSLEL